MHRFYVPPGECDQGTIQLSEHQAHHALHVLRLRSGNEVVVLDGIGNEYRGEVCHLTRKTIDVAVRQKHSTAEPACKITLLQAVPKGKIFDSIVQKATELGASRVVPLLTDRVVRQFDDHKADSKVEHWRAIAIESIKQCGSLWLPHIEAPIPLADFIGRDEKFALALIASFESDSRHPREQFDRFRKQSGKANPESVCIWVGPEGDFTPAELSAARFTGALPITLGRLVLRSETAAIYCLSIVNHETSGL